MVLAIDPGDVDRRHAEACEFLGKVRDGSTGEIISGYPLLSVVARDGRRGKTIPLLLRLFSASETGHGSENDEILLAMERVERSVGSPPGESILLRNSPSGFLWVIDRGGDRLNGSIGYARTIRSWSG